MDSGSRLAAVLLAGVLVVAACASNTPLVPASQSTAPSAGQSTTPSDSQAPTTTQPSQPTTSGAPQPSDGVPSDFPDLSQITEDDLNPPREPLPEPVLETVDQVLEAMYAVGPEDQIIVSMLNLLGVGIYREDGTVIRAGTEQSDADFYMFEPEVYGLISMLRQGVAGENWIDFTEFHAAMVELGLEATPEELIAAYSDAYAANPDAAMTKFVQANAFLALEAQVPPLGVWLLFVDGTIPPHGSTPVASIGSAFPPIAQPPGANLGIGIATHNLAQYRGPLTPQQAIQAARIAAVLDGATMELVREPGTVHEGHGGAGESSTFTATIKPYSPRSPLTGLFLLGNTASPAAVGVPVTWQYDSTLTDHGSADVGSGASNPTDTRGQAKLNYTTQPEVMPDYRRGYLLTDVASVNATASKADVIAKMFPSPPPGLARFVRAHNGTIAPRDPVQLRIQWHEPRAMHLRIEHKYKFWLGTNVAGKANSDGIDRFDGVLVEQPDGTWTGAVFATADGTGHGIFFGVNPCTLDWYGSQVLEVFGEKDSGVLPGQSSPIADAFVLYFYPLTPPRDRFGNAVCPAARRHGARFDYAPFNSSSIFEPSVGLPIANPFAARTFTETYLIPSKEGVTLQNTYWKVDIELLEPPP